MTATATPEETPRAVSGGDAEREQPAPLRILHLEDNPADAFLVRNEIDSAQPALGAVFDLVGNRQQYEAALKQGCVDLILCDYRIPGYDGDEALKAARALHPDVPVIVVSGELGEERAIETLKAGATDYVLKDNLRRLVPAIRRALKEAHINRERCRAEAYLAADLAALTRMHNLSGVMLGAEGIGPILQKVMEAAVAVVKADYGTLQLLEGDSLKIVAHHAHKQPFLDFFASAEAVPSVCGEATRRGERVVVPDVEASPALKGTGSLAVMRAAGVRAVQSTPLISRKGVLLGVLTTQWAAPYQPDEHDLWRMDLLARQASDLIEQNQAHETLRQVAENLRLMVEAATRPRILVNGQGVVEASNGPAAQLLGYEPGQLEGLNVEELALPLSRMELMLHLDDLKRHSPRPITTSMRAKLKDGAIQWMTIEASVMSAGTSQEKYLIRFEKLEFGPASSREGLSRRLSYA